MNGVVPARGHKGCHCGSGSGARPKLRRGLSNGVGFSRGACSAGPGLKGGLVPEPRVGPEPYCATELKVSNRIVQYSE